VPETVEPSPLGSQVEGDLLGEAVVVERISAGHDHEAGAAGRAGR